MTSKTPMLYARQIHLLALLDALGGNVANLDFQKLLFMYCQETDAPPDYEFIPYRLGAFSFTSYADRRKLAQHGLIGTDEQTWRLTVTGRKAIAGKYKILKPFQIFAGKYQEIRGDMLVAESYRQYPYYGTRSEIARRVLKKDPEALLQIDKARTPQGHAGLTTIGYEGRSFEGYLNTLIEYGVAVLCDVRRNPLSRKYGFSKSTLSKGCASIGVRYEHLPELGIASEQRLNLKTQSDYDLLFQRYDREVLPMQGVALRKICSWVKNGEKVALTCYERLPIQCHRKYVAERLEKEFGCVFTPTHL
jgi:hypothetical protein